MSEDCNKQIDGEYEATIEITEVNPHVFIGSWDNSVDLDYLKAYNIRTIVNLTDMKKRPETLKAMEMRNINYRHFSIENIGSFNLKPFLPGLYNLIKQHIDAKANILLHCQQGIGTSVAVIAYYYLRLMYANHKPKKSMLSSIFRMIREKRLYIDVNTGFIEQLEDIECELSGQENFIPPHQSMSIGRNKILCDQLNKQMVNNVISEINQANKNYIVEHKVRY